MKINQLGETVLVKDFIKEGKEIISYNQVVNLYLLVPTSGTKFEISHDFFS